MLKKVKKKKKKLKLFELDDRVQVNIYYKNIHRDGT